MSPVWSRLFPGLPEQVGASRRFTRAVLAGRGDSYAVEVVVSELSTNAVRHTDSGLPNGWFIVHLLVWDDRIRVRVLDLGGKNEPAMVTDANGDQNGRGLLTVAAIATVWGVEGNEAGRVVWADIPRQQSA